MIPPVSSVSVIGLGKLGSPIAACFAAKGFAVVGVDADPASVETVGALRAPVFEPGLEELLQQGNGRISTTQMTSDAVEATNATFIIVPTPSDADDGFSLEYLLTAAEQIGQGLARTTSYHLVVITSTVMPGSTNGPIREALERASGKQCGVDFGLCYSPEFIALGSVIHDFLNPDFHLIGESDPRAGDVLESIYRRVCDTTAPVARMNFVNAELTKLAVNTFVTTKIAFANTLARLCERLPQADVDVVTSAIGLDTRIGREYLRGAISYGGPCFPRDNFALASLARRLNAPALIAEATDRANRQDVRALADRVLTLTPDGGTVAVLGLAYKPNTDVFEESPGVLLAETLGAGGTDVVVYDPAARAALEPRLIDVVRVAETLEEAVRAASVLVITTPWEEFRRIPAALREPDNRTLVVVDCWRILDRTEIATVADYVALGEGEDVEAAYASTR